MGKRKWKKKVPGRPASPTARVVRIGSDPPPPPWTLTPIAEATAYAEKRAKALGVPLKLEDVPADVKAQIDQQIAEGKTEIVVILPPYGDVEAMAREIVEGGKLAPIRVEKLPRRTDAVAAALALAASIPVPCDDLPKPRRRFPIPR